MLSFDQNLSRTFHLTWNKSRSLYTLSPLLLFRTHLLLLYPVFTLLQPCYPPCCSLKMYGTFHEALVCVLVQSSTSWFPCLQIFIQIFPFQWDFFWLLYLIMHLICISYVYTCCVDFLWLTFLVASVMGWIVSLEGCIKSPLLQYLGMWFYLEITSVDLLKRRWCH